MKRIVTIGRQCGSGGRLIGQTLAKELDLQCYDERIIDMVAKESGLAHEFVEEKGERITGSLLFNIASSMTYANNVFAGNGRSLQDEIFFIQNKIIKDLAEKGPCVIVGRSADYILRERLDCLRVFIFADEQSKFTRAVKEYGMPEKEAASTLKKNDKARYNHYKYYTDRDWGLASNYDLCLNSGLFGIQGCVDIIKAALREN